MRAGVNPLPHRHDVVENLIGRYGVDGANSAKALEWACRRYLSGHGGLLRRLPADEAFDGVLSRLRAFQRAFYERWEPQGA